MAMAQEEPEVPQEELVVPLAVQVVPELEAGKVVPLAELEARLLVVCLTASAVPAVLVLALSAGPAVELEWGLLGELPVLCPTRSAGLLLEEVLVPAVPLVEVVLSAALAGRRAVLAASAEAAMTPPPTTPLVPLPAATLQTSLHSHPNPVQARTWRSATKVSRRPAARTGPLSASRAPVPPCC